ncbi:MAG: hypothetical protein JNJ45_05445 [Chthonomonas sp.]|nr:hypothetical protein [Chthonomonas sp.]
MPACKWWEGGPHAEAIKKAIRQLQSEGPARILCDDGFARSPQSIGDLDKSIYLNAPIIFIRDDGWTLGVHRGNQAEAHQMWKSTWVAFVLPGKFEDLPLHISEYNEVPA